MQLQVLGSAAGGGLPQWNCGCANCRAVRAGEAGLTARTQDSVALSADDRTWFLLNASPDLRQQIENFAPLQPRAPRHTPIGAILLTNGDIDHCLGLFLLRESSPLALYATESVWRGLSERNTLFRTLRRFPEQLVWRPLPLGKEVELADAQGTPSGLFARALPVAGKLPLHLESIETPSPQDNIGLWIRQAAGGRALAYVPGAASIEGILSPLSEVDCVLFDGTFFTSDELRAEGLGAKRAEEMAHLPMGGERGSLAQLASLKTPHRIYTHINNSNPVLRPSRERKVVEAAGWQIAHDGMAVHL